MATIHPDAAERVKQSGPTFERMTDGRLVKFTSFGCYPVLYLTKRGECLCADCANADEAKEYSDDPIVAADANWEDPSLHCDDCGERIESAYAEDDAV